MSMIVGTINPYTYSTIPNPKISSSDHPKIGLKRFCFRDKRGYRYFVEAEIYEYNTCAIKFYVHAHKSSPLRYNLLTNHGDARKIIETCIQIGVDLYKEDDLISFCFIGAPSDGEFQDRGYNQTKRFRVYALISKFLLNPETFTHTEISESSFYILVNNKAASHTPDLFEKIRIMFSQNYDIQDFFPDLEELKQKRLTRSSTIPRRKR